MASHAEAKTFLLTSMRSLRAEKRALDPLALKVLEGRIRDGNHAVTDVELGE